MTKKKVCTKRNLAHLSLLTAQLCFSGWHIIGSLAMKDGADPFIFALYRELVASFLMYGLVVFNGLDIKIDKCDYKRFFFLGCCSFVNVVGSMLSLRYISATRFAIFQPSIPCIATVISICVRLEKFTFLKAFGILLAVGGAVLTEVWNSGSDEEKNVTLGTMIVSCQVLAMACLIVFQKPILSKYEPAAVTFTYYTVGTVLTIVLCAAFSYQFTLADLYFNSELLPWCGLAYAASFATLFPYNVMSWAGKQLSPSLTTVYCTFQPVGTIFLSFIVFGSVITAPEGIGAAMVMCGLIVTVYGQRLERKKLHRHSVSGDFDSDEEAPVEHFFLLDENNLDLPSPSAPPRTFSSSSGRSVTLPYNPVFVYDREEPRNDSPVRNAVHGNGMR